jgi:hypothetical protein
MRDLNEEGLGHAGLLESAWLEAACDEVVLRTVSYGDGDLANKAARVLRVGALQILNGHRSDRFLEFLALGILSHLDGDEASLDHAFRLKSRTGRPPFSVEKEADVIAAFQRAILKLHGAPPLQRWDRALNWAIKARYGASPKEVRAQHASWRSIRFLEDWRKETVKLLAKYGYARPDRPEKK